MKVLLAAHHLELGGIGTLTNGLAATLPHFTPADVELVVIGSRAIAGANGFGGALGVPLILQHRLGRHLYEQTRVATASWGVDLVHLLEPRPLLATKTPFVFTLHDVFFLDHPEWYPPKSARLKRMMLAAAVARQPRRILCVSSYTRSRLLAHYPRLEDTAVVVYPGITRHEISDDAVEDAYFLTVSAIEPRKNHLLLLEAFRLARSRGLRLRWKVVGTAGYRSRDIVRALHREPEVDVVGRVSNEERDRLYRHAAFCAFPSHAEGFGFPPLEAMAFGRAVVCSTGSALDETVGKAALRVPSGDVAAWANALTMLAEDTAERAQLAEKGHEAVTSFSWHATARRHFDCYRVAL